MAITLSRDDIAALEAVVATEVGAGWRGQTLQDGVNAIVDTILNRVESPSFPGGVSAVINQDRQFSDINFPGRSSAYGAWQNVPQSRIRGNDNQIRAAVQSALVDRAIGTRSTVGPSLNYANPFYSGRNAQPGGWVNDIMQNPYAVTGYGRSMHVHGTAPGVSPLGQEPDIQLTQDAIDYVAPPMPAAKGEEAPVNPIRETLLSTLETGAIPVFDEGPLSRSRVTGFGSPYADAARAVPTTPVERSMLADLPSLAPFGTMAPPIGSAPVTPVERGSLPDIIDAPTLGSPIATGLHTIHGRDTYVDWSRPDFGLYSEKSVSFPTPAGWVTAPSVDEMGNVHGEDWAYENVMRNGPIDPITGEVLPTHAAQQDAENYAVNRSASLMQGGPGVFDTIRSDLGLQSAIGSAPANSSMPGNVGMMEFAGMPSISPIGFSATGSGSGSRGANASYDGSIASPISVDATGMGSGSRGASASYSGSVASPVGEVPSSIGQSIMDMGLSPSTTATLNERSWTGAPASPASSPFSGPSITDIGFSGMDLASPFSAVDFPGSMPAVSVPSVSAPAAPAPTISAPSVAPSLGVNTPSASGIAAPADKPDKKADDTGSKVGRNVGRAIGGLAGGMMLGPLGAVAGALIGGQIGKRGGSIDLPSLGSLGGIVSPDGWAATPYGQAEAAGRTANGGFSPSGFWSGYAGAGGGDSAESMAIAMSREQDARSNAGMGTFGDMFGGGGSGPSGGGGCFITTAAVEIAGEPDDGDTLQTLRWFRDNVMRKRPDWSADVEAYYRIAPEIVRRLNGDREVYADLMTRFIRPAVAAIKRQDFDGAYSLYRSMVESLA